MVLGSVLTFAYSARFMWGAFAVKPGVPATPFKPIKPAFLAAPAVLSLLTVVYGLWPAPVDAWIQPYAALFVPRRPRRGGRRRAPGAVARVHPGAGADGGHRSRWAWPCSTAATPSPGCRAGCPGWIDGDRAYQLTIGALDDAAVWVTGRTQRGSLFFYLAVILTVAFVLPLTALLLANKPLPGDLYFIDPGSPLQLVVGAGIVIGALAAVRANKRFLAVLMVSVTGYGIALMFALQGAPDLALTQMLVETIILVAFVLAMRSLPAELRDRTGGKYRVDPGDHRRGVRRHHGLRGHLRPGRPRGTAGLAGVPAAGLRGRRRTEHRQRDPRGHPRLGHLRRDLRPGAGRHRRGQPHLRPGPRRPDPDVRECRGGNRRAADRGQRAVPVTTPPSR